LASVLSISILPKQGRTGAIGATVVVVSRQLKPPCWRAGEDEITTVNAGGLTCGGAGDRLAADARAYYLFA
jgi:hypothetical protein